jgi:hypothetical protein
MPRSRGDNGWRHVRDEPHRGRAAVLEDIEGVPVVRVPVVVTRWVRQALRRAGQWVITLARAGFFLAFAVVWVVHAMEQWFGQVWPVLVFTGALVLLAIGSGTYRLVRLRRWPSPGPRADVLLSLEGVGVGDVVVPWYQIERVVRFHFAAPSARRRTRNFLALEVLDYVGVRGLTPMRAGLANLTRRRYLVLAETTELSRPEQLASALERLVADPSSRELLTRSDGCRLVDEGPAMVIWRSP